MPPLLYHKACHGPCLAPAQALRYGKWVRVRAGDIIVHGPEARLRFFVLVEGQAKINSMYKGLLVEPRPLLSGSCFDMGGSRGSPAGCLPVDACGTGRGRRAAVWEASPGGLALAAPPSGRNWAPQRRTPRDGAA